MKLARTSRRVALLAAAISLAPHFASTALAVDAIPVINPSFQAQDFPAFPGYLGGANPAAITGWAATGGAGINGTDIGAGAPFADNGTIADSTRVAFIQGSGSLSQTLGGFSVGSLYWVQGFANARGPGANDNPVISVTLGSDLLLPATLITPVGGTAPYRFVNLPWTASAASAALTINSTPNAGGDATLVLDGISVTKRSVDDVVIANPSFEASGLNFAFPGYIGNVAGWSRAGGGQLAINGTSANTSGNPFADNGAVPDGDDVIGLQQAITISQILTGLTIGQAYRLTLEYNSRVGDDPTAVVTIDGNTALNAAVPEVGGANPYNHLSYDFTAIGTTTTLAIANQAVAGDSTLLVDNVRVFKIVPEPSAFAAFAIGGLLLARRRKTR